MSPETTAIGWLGLAASLSLVGVALALSLAQRLRLEATIVRACLRAAAQLLLVGWALVLVFDDDTPEGLAWLWVVGMVLFSGWTVRNRAREVPGVLWLGLGAAATITTVSLGVVFGLGIFPVEPQVIIPIAGMMIGNSMSETVLAARRTVGELRDHRLEIEARLALGYPAPEAARPRLREALRTAIVPQIERTKAVGIVILPGAMTGLILAGVDPVDAVQVQLAIMYLILGSVVTSATVVGLGLSRRLFTPDDRLVRLPEPQ